MDKSKYKWYSTTKEFISNHLEDFYKRFYPDSDLIESGKDYRLEPCPICQHSDCCTVYDDRIYCFSKQCSLDNDHLNGWLKDYRDSSLKISFHEAIKRIESFTKKKYPIESQEDYEKREIELRRQKILSQAEIFYHNKLLSTQEKFLYNNNYYTPYEFLTLARKRKREVIEELMFGFSKDYLELRKLLLESNYTAEEINEAKIWIPENFFVFFYRDQATKDIVRINTKNPFQATTNDSKEVMKGFSVGDKSLFFSPKFTFKKPIILVEGENDMAAVIENGYDNVACYGGNIDELSLSVLKNARKEIYAFFDNDESGMKYLKELNEKFADKIIKQIKYPKEFKDPDEYYNSDHPIKLSKLMTVATELDVKKYKISRNKNVWIMKNRFESLIFEIKSKNDRGECVGVAKYFKRDVLEDQSNNVPLTSCRGRMKPLNFKLNDTIDAFFNSDLDSRSNDELIDIYKFSAKKVSIHNIIAKRLYKNPSNKEMVINNIKLSGGSDDFVDEILKELNNIQNKSLSIKTSKIPKIKISQYFNEINDDAYFYFTYIKEDGDVQRKLPFLLRNDKELIRLDLLKRKDPQCLLLLDNKYELLKEIQYAILDTDDCSLNQDFVLDYVEGRINEDDLCPLKLVNEIKDYVEKFYSFEDKNMYNIIALYIFMTYFYEVFTEVPYLYVTGEKGSGKSALGAILKMFCFNAKMTYDITESALFRGAAIDGGVIILDELEDLKSRKDAMKSGKGPLLKGGYSKTGEVMRSNMEKDTVDKFNMYGPKVILNVSGLEDIIQDRCIKIKTYIQRITKKNKKQNPKLFYDNHTDIIKSLTSRCCFSALENYKKVFQLYEDYLFETDNPRLSKILNPLAIMARLVDEKEIQSKMTENPDEDHIGQYEKALYLYYETRIKHDKSEQDKGTPEGVIRRMIPRIARELIGDVPKSDIEYIDTSDRKYDEEIRYNQKEGWFEVNILHIKCFIEEQLPQEIFVVRNLSAIVKNIFNIKEDNIKRRKIKIDNEELLKELNYHKNSKVLTFRFYVNDLISEEEMFKNNLNNINKYKNNNKNSLF